MILISQRFLPDVRSYYYREFVYCFVSLCFPFKDFYLIIWFGNNMECIVEVGSFILCFCRWIYIVLLIPWAYVCVTSWRNRNGHTSWTAFRTSVPWWWCSFVWQTSVDMWDCFCGPLIPLFSFLMQLRWTTESCELSLRTTYPRSRLRRNWLFGGTQKKALFLWLLSLVGWQTWRGGIMERVTIPKPDHCMLVSSIP